jgi:hypothetical protein
MLAAPSWTCRRKLPRRSQPQHDSMILRLSCSPRRNCKRLIIRSDGDTPSGRWPGPVHTAHLPWCLRGQAHRYLLGRKSPRCPGGQGCQALSRPSGCTCRNFDQWSRQRASGRFGGEAGQASGPGRAADRAHRATVDPIRYSAFDPIVGGRRESRHAGDGSLRPLAAAGGDSGRRHTSDAANHDRTNSDVPLTTIVEAKTPAPYQA